MQHFWHKQSKYLYFGFKKICFEKNTYISNLWYRYNTNIKPCASAFPEYLKLFVNQIFSNYTFAVWLKNICNLTCRKHSCTMLTFSLVEYKTARTISYSVMLCSSPPWLEWIESTSCVFESVAPPNFPPPPLWSWLSPLASALSLASSPTPEGVSVNAEHDRPLSKKKSKLTWRNATILTCLAHLSVTIQSKTNRMKAFKAQKCSGSNSAASSRTNGSPATKEQAGKEGNMEKAEGEEERIADS